MILLIAFFIALLISFLFMIEYKSNSTAATIVFFVILFMAGIASQYWITPFGPILWGVAFFPVLIVVLIFTFLLFIPPMHYRVSRKREVQEDNSATIGLFTWLLIILLFIAILVGFFRKMPA